MLKAIYVMEAKEVVEKKTLAVAEELEAMEIKEAARCARQGYAATPTYMRFPREHW